jgi:D-galactarolactone cycloisomerase
LHTAVPELPLALGESYRTRREMSWFLQEGLVRFVQPDLGRSGITESLRIADAGVTVVPHVSIALGPQIAAAIHLCSALPNAPLCEFNPAVFETANRFLRNPVVMQNACYALPPSIEFVTLPAQD